MTFEETYQKYLDESDPDYHPSMKSLFEWFFDAGRSDGIAWAERFTAEQCVEAAERQASLFKPGSWDQQACFSVANRIRGNFKLSR